MYILWCVIVFMILEVESNKCGYESCPVFQREKLNVHLIPHTHVDVGWLKTIDQYFFGKTLPQPYRYSYFEEPAVKTIIDNVIIQLELDENRRFIWVETAFLWQWWTQGSNDTMREKLYKLVQNGQMEITGGGWTMNDEAVTYYQNTIDQFTWGFRKLDEIFGPCGRPHIGWQIDPFGHSRDSASLMASLGFDAVFLGRIDYRDREARILERRMEFVWQPSPNLGKSSWLFTNILYDNYGPPYGFCFDSLCDNDVIVEDENDFYYNLEYLIGDFIMQAKEQADSYKSNNILMTMGGDFNYMNAEKWYTNMDKLIKYVNAQGEIHVTYSTPACYVRSVNEANFTWHTKQDDFLPYANEYSTYWSGFYTSRPTLKYFERQANSLLQVCKQVTAVTNASEDNIAEMTSLREGVAVLQHHDAVTGTEKQHVAQDYAARLYLAVTRANNATNVAINKLMRKTEESPTLDLKPCLLLNISMCDVSEQNDNFVVNVYNPLARVVSHFVRLPVANHHYSVLDQTGTEIPVQLLVIAEHVLRVPGRISLAHHELVFHAANLPALGFRSYFVQKGEMNKEQVMPVTGEQGLNIGNKFISAHFNKNTNLLASVNRGEEDIKLEQKFKNYQSRKMDETFEFAYSRTSGAYIFKPNKTKYFDNIVNTTTYKGSLVEEIHQTIEGWVSQVIRIYKDEPYMEFEWQVGPIPIDDLYGKEIVSQFSTSWSTNGTFFTDSNGREIVKRVRNSRESWPLYDDVPLASNFYPVTSHIIIKDGDKQLTVLTDRAQAGSSIKDGEVELMVHRRLLKDDSFGVGEPLNETAYNGVGLVARGRHVVLLDVEPHVRHEAQNHVPPWLLLSPTNLTAQQWQQNYVTEYSGLQSLLPEDVHLLTLEPWKGTSLLLRLEHCREVSDLATPRTFAIKDIFSAFTIVSVEEMNLGANQKLSESSRLVWKVKNKESSSKSNNTAPIASDNFTISLNPMQIRTFVIQVIPRTM